MYALTGANGHLGRLVIKHLLTQVPANQIIATTRDPQKLADIASLGVVVRCADFSDPTTLAAAYAGATRLLIISTYVVGHTVELHEVQQLQQEKQVLREGLKEAIQAIERLQEHTSNLEGQIGVLQDRVKMLEGQQAKDSHNSNLPPSSDRFVRVPKSLKQGIELFSALEQTLTGHPVLPAFAPPY